MSIDINEIDLRKLELNLLLVFTALMRERSVSEAHILDDAASVVSLASGSSASSS
jgi:hypothetical protein